MYKYPTESIEAFNNKVWKGKYMKNYRDITMLQPDTLKISLLMAKHELDSKSLAEASGVSKNIIYAIRRGNLVKPKYFGKVAKVLNCNVEDIIKNSAAAPEIMSQ